jgi:signal transduction histidine kinase
VILVQAGAARLLQDRDPDGSRRALATFEQVARETIGEIDRLVRVLRSGDDADSGEPAPADPAAIEELVERYRAAGLRVSTEVDGRRRAVPRSVAWAAYRILQEALTNAARHGPGQAEVAVRFGSDAVEIRVSNPAAPDGGASEGHGIVGMRERATLLGGTLRAGRTDGVFRVHAHLPHAEATR